MNSEQAFVAIQSHCLSKEGAIEDEPWEGHAGWKIAGKLFGIGSPGSGVLTVKNTPDKQALLIQHPNVEKAAYVGRYGWVTVTVNSEESLEMALDLIDESYDLVAPKRRRATSSKAVP